MIIFYYVLDYKICLFCVTKAYCPSFITVLDYEVCLYWTTFLKIAIVCLENTTYNICVIIDPPFSYVMFFTSSLELQVFLLDVVEDCFVSKHSWCEECENRGHLHVVTHNLATEASNKWYKSSKHPRHIVASPWWRKFHFVYAGNENAHAHKHAYASFR